MSEQSSQILHSIARHLDRTRDFLAEATERGAPRRADDPPRKEKV